MIGIYKILSPSGRVYIGESIDIEKRWKSYISLHCKTQRKLYNSFLKYGVENHTFEMIEECLLEELLCRERHWQEFYDVLNGGLNCKLSICGDIKQVMSKESIKKIINTKVGSKYSTQHCENISKGKKGKTKSSETKKRMSDSRKGKPSPTKGIALSNEHKNKIRNSLIGSKHTEDRINNITNNCAKSRKVINLKNNEIFKSVREVSNLFNIPYSNLLRKLNNPDKNDTDFIFE